MTHVDIQHDLDNQMQTDMPSFILSHEEFPELNKNTSPVASPSAITHTIIENKPSLYNKRPPPSTLSETTVSYQEQDNTSQNTPNPIEKTKPPKKEEKMLE